MQPIFVKRRLARAPTFYVKIAAGVVISRAYQVLTGPDRLVIILTTGPTRQEAGLGSR